VILTIPCDDEERGEDIGSTIASDPAKPFVTVPPRVAGVSSQAAFVIGCGISALH